MPSELITSRGDEFTLNTSGSLVSAASLTTTQTTTDQTNTSCRGVKVCLDWLAHTGGGSVTLAVQGKDDYSGKYYTLLAGAIVTGSTASTTVYTVYPGATVSSSLTVSDVLPRTWRVVVTANNSNAASYTVGYALVL